MEDFNLKPIEDLMDKSINQLTELIKRTNMRNEEQQADLLIGKYQECPPMISDMLNEFSNWLFLNECSKEYCTPKEISDYWEEVRVKVMKKRFPSQSA